MAKELKLNLPPADDLFSTQEERNDTMREKVIIVPAEEVKPYARQPYCVNRLSNDLIRLMDSIVFLSIPKYSVWS
jgi:ParB family chromosome partitioning protein